MRTTFIGPCRPARLVINLVSEGTGVTYAQMRKKVRYARIVEVKHRAMRAVQRETRMSTPQIARLFNNTDHTTVVYACGKSDIRLEDLPPLPPEAYDEESPPPELPAAPPPPPVIIPEPIFVESRCRDLDAWDPSKPTPIQHACRAATERLISDLTGARGFARVKEARQDRRPTWA